MALLTDLDKTVQPRNARKTSTLAHTQGWSAAAAYSLIARDSRRSGKCNVYHISFARNADDDLFVCGVRELQEINEGGRCNTCSCFGLNNEKTR